jgi:hypothetical protein
MVQAPQVKEKLRELLAADPKLFAKHFDARLLDVPLIRVAANDPPPDGVIPLVKDAQKEKGEEFNADVIQENPWTVVAITPGGTYGILKAKWAKDMFGHELCDLLVLDEASQMSLPEAMMAALPLKPDAPLIVVGDHRQMPPIGKHDWENEARRTFQQYQVYESLFDALRAKNPPMIQFAESFRLHSAMAEFLRQEVYRHDDIAYFSTVERFQGGERTVIMVSATESDRAYLLASSKFLLDPRRLTVALRRAKRKMILVASRSIFSLFSPDEGTFTNSLLWKNLLLRTCSTLLRKGNGQGKRWRCGVGRLFQQSPLSMMFDRDRISDLTRDDPRYILDPHDVHGPGFPGETFRVKDNETRKFGEYRTRRLVLEAWDKMK